MKHQSQTEPSAAFFTGAADFKCFARYPRSNNLSTPGAGEIQHATHSGSQLERGLN